MRPPETKQPRLNLQSSLGKIRELPYVQSVEIKGNI